MTSAAPSKRSLEEEIVNAFNYNLYDIFGQTELLPSTMLWPENTLKKPDSVDQSIITIEVDFGRIE